ncbi:alpha/beta hydrolase [Geomonas sp. Red32]|uniref:alpha/beta hydrolase n=1 Tax=Geomonas sp. Red32 TaxID=2912856 RepID=UPI00202CE02D|nr:alpha/beta hydrolase [Geomonas sp. Red32]MCM0081571.1 alpha/beta hydrolase [Geomonas sp. Red32]
MMFLRLAIVFLLLLLPFDLLAAGDRYGYPIEGAYEATILGTPPQMIPVYPEKIRMRSLVLDVLPERVKPPIFFYDTGLRCTFAWQKKKAPLVFLIAGTGASDRADKLITMLKAFYHAGFHVITLPSPTNANFIVSASRSCIPGDLTDDSADLYHAMEVAWEKVRGEIEVSSFNLCGYSLGGDQAAFVAKLDEDRQVFNFRKVLMIDPSVSIYTSITRIEDLLKKVPGGPHQEGIFFNRMLSRFSEYYRSSNFVTLNDEFLYTMYRERLFSSEETGGLISLTFRINLGGMIFASDVMTNSGYIVPKNKVLMQSDSLYDYFMVSSHLSFFEYFNEYFYPYFQSKRPGLTIQQLAAAQSLKSIEGYLANTPKIGVVANENDFLMGPGDLEYLRNLFGPRLKVYPKGGHLGNLEYRDNLEEMVAFFR